MTNEEKLIKADRMRYTKNKLSSNLTLLAIVFDVLYFVSIYQSDVGSYYYRIIIGASIIYNLVFMLAAFLASEGIKNYNIQYAYLLFAVGIGQIIRIFILPMQARAATVVVQGVDTVVMGGGQFGYVVCCLLASALCCIAAALVGIQKSRTLAAYEASLKAGTV